MTAYDFSFVRNTSIAFDATADSINMGAIDASTVQVAVSGSDLVLTVGSDTVTLQGTTPDQVSATNVTFGSATTRSAWLVGDGLNTSITDGIANTIDDNAAPFAFSHDQNNLVYGLGGGDNITVGNGNNIIFGGTGIADSSDGGDTIVVGSGANTVYGNAGNDSVDAGVPNSSGLTNNYFLGLGNDTLDAAGHTHLGNFVIYGNTGDDSIDMDGTTGDMTIFGGNGAADSTDGADRIEWSTGSAEIYGNSGADTLVGGVITAGKTQNVFAGLGDDNITAGGAANSTSTIYGNTGADTINASTLAANSNATIFGGNGISDSTDGNDTITVGAGTVTVYGNAGNDTFNITNLGANGNATVFTGLGNDTVNINTNNTASSSVITLATGNERVNYDATAGELTTINGFSATDDVFAFDLAAAETAADLIFANGFFFRDVSNDGVYQAATEEAVNFSGFTGDFTATNMLVTQGGIGGASVGRVLTNINGTAATTLTGTTTSDLLVSGALGDTLVSGDGADKMEGNAGDDVFQLTNVEVQDLDQAGSQTTINGGGGVDRIQITTAAATVAVADFSTRITEVEVLELGNFTGNSVTLGAPAATSGITTVDADAVTTGTTTLNGNAFEANLTYLGGAASDQITRGAGTGTDNFNLGAGGDTFSIDLADLSSADTVIGGGGTDQFTFSTTGNIADSVFTNVTEFETITLADGAANTLQGGAQFIETGITQITGGNNADSINMGPLTTNVTIDGAVGADIITGGSAIDSITGGNDADNITGGGGSDNINLTEGAGAIDTLNYTASTEFGDNVTAFATGQDVFTFASTFGDGGLAGAVDFAGAGDSANLAALTTAAGTDREGYVIEDVALTLASYSQIDTAIANGTAATGAGFVLADDATNSALLYDADFATTGNLTLVALLNGVADASGGEGVTIL